MWVLFNFTKNFTTLNKFVQYFCVIFSFIKYFEKFSFYILTPLLNLFTPADIFIWLMAMCFSDSGYFSFIMTYFKMLPRGWGRGSPSKIMKHSLLCDTLFLSSGLEEKNQSSK